MTYSALYDILKIVKEGKVLNVSPGRPEEGGPMEEMTKEEMQRFLIKEAQRGSTEMEAYRNLMEILGIEFPVEKDE